MSGAFSAFSAADLANASASPPFAPPPPPFASSPPSSSPSSSPIAGNDQQQNQKHQQQFKNSFRRAIQLIGRPKEQKENADIKRERETNTEQQQQGKTREKMMPSLPAAVPCSSASSSPLCAPMDPLSQLMASFAASHHNQQQQRGASLPPGPPPPPPPRPPVSSFLPNGAQFAAAGPFFNSAHPPPPDFNALLAIAPPGVLGPFFAGGVANAPFVPPPPEMLFSITQQPHNQNQPTNGATNSNNGTASNGTSGMPSGIPPGAFPFPLDPAMLANYMVPAEARRKNATREVTAPLKQWLNSHRKNPYPTKAEKTFLAMITNMSMTQVSTWFANARRRLKKENKMTWSPRNRPNDEDDFFEMDEGAEAATEQNTMRNGAEGPSSPELEDEEEEEEEQNGTRGETMAPQQRPRRAIWSIADTLGEETQWERQHNDKQKRHKEEPNEQDEMKHSSSTKHQQNFEGERDGGGTKVKQEAKTEQQEAQLGHKCEQNQHEQRAESPRSGPGDHCAVRVLAASRSPHPLPHAVPPPLDFLLGSPAVPHPMLLPFPPADFPNARQNFLFALQHQNQLHHQRSLMTAANPMIAAMFLAQQFAAQNQQMGGTAGEQKQMDGAAPAEEHHQREKEDGPEDKRQQKRERNDGVSLLPLPPQPPPFIHLHHHHHLSSSVSPTSSVLVGQKRSAAQMPTESADNGIPLTKRQCRAET
ncbi:hypothetical protein niasHS_003576 [Heterodera schachtii]|uniref:Homeobox domain-containing protein n=1 Tax=Heterodera schachtii TaxID=97005 RepID=A0ABD2KGX2_HETSC